VRLYLQAILVRIALSVMFHVLTVRGRSGKLSFVIFPSAFLIALHRWVSAQYSFPLWL
jgi:hypothetical protein